MIHKKQMYRNKTKIFRTVATGIKENFKKNDEIACFFEWK